MKRRVIRSSKSLRDLASIIRKRKDLHREVPNHLVFYRSTDEEIIIERVIHGARDIEALFAEEG